MGSIGLLMRARCRPLTITQSLTISGLYRGAYDPHAVFEQSSGFDVAPKTTF
jgi:hypothetical protein